MCQSFEATTSCILPDSRSVIRSRRSTEHARLLANTQYIRLAEGRGYVVPTSRRPSSVTISDRHDRVKLDQSALPLSSANQVFEVGF